MNKGDSVRNIAKVVIHLVTHVIVELASLGIIGVVRVAVAIIAVKVFFTRQNQLVRILVAEIRCCYLAVWRSTEKVGGIHGVLFGESSEIIQLHGFSDGCSYKRIQHILIERLAMFGR